MTRRLLLAVAALAILGALCAPTAGAQTTRDVTIDFTDAGTGELPRDFFNSSGLIFDEDGSVAVVEGDEAASGSSDSALRGTFNGTVSALAVSVSPNLRGLTQFFEVVTTEFTLTALDAGGGVVESQSVQVVTDSTAGTGFGYVAIDLGSLPSAAPSFQLTAELVGEQPDFCAPNCPAFLGANEITYTIEEPEEDTVPPFLDVRDSRATVNATTPGGVAFTYETRSSDNRDLDPDVVCDPPSGSVFPVGLTTVECVATDASGNSASATFDVLVNPPPDPAKDYAVGQGEVLGIQRFVLFAEANPDGSNAVGTFDLEGSQYDLEARVTCMRIAGNRVFVGGEITHDVSTGGNRGFVLAFIDNGGSGTPDRVLDFGHRPEAPISCPLPPTSGTGVFDIDGRVVVHNVHPPTPLQMVGKGSLTGGGKTASYTYVVRCDPAANTNAPFEVRFTGGQRFRLSSTSSVTCTDDPAVKTPPAGFDTQTGTGTGTLTTGGPGAITWRFVDGGPGGASDVAEITIRNAAGAIVFQGSGAPPGPFPGSTQLTGQNTAQGGGGTT